MSSHRHTGMVTSRILYYQTVGEWVFDSAAMTEPSDLACWSQVAVVELGKTTATNGLSVAKSLGVEATSVSSAVCSAVCCRCAAEAATLTWKCRKLCWRQ
jgi:hypothetical protein